MLDLYPISDTEISEDEWIQIARKEVDGLLKAKIDNEKLRCCERQHNETSWAWYCTRLKKHDGPHVAYVFNVQKPNEHREYLAIWTNKS